MPAIKCPACGYSHRHIQQICMNCGQALVVDTTLSLNSPSAQASRGLAQKTVVDTVDERRENSSFHATALTVHIEQDNSAPYSIPSPETSAGFQNFISSTPANGKSTKTEEPWKNERLPLGIPLFKPQLMGSVIHIETREQLNDYPNLFGVLLSMLAEIIWVMPNVHTSRETIDKIETTRLRIHASNGKPYDAVLYGNLSGANLSMGDTVSLWGNWRKGRLMVRKGYDYTSHSIITTSTTNMLIPALIVLSILVALYLYINHFSFETVFTQIKEIPVWFDQLRSIFFHQ